MPLTPEEPQIHESVPAPRTAAGTARNPQAARPAPPVPGPRPAPRPAPPGAGRERPGPARTDGTASTGPAARIELVAAADATALEAADETVDKLLEEGRAPGEILLLTTGEEHPWAQHELSFGEDSYWRQLTEGEDVFCARASAAERVGNRPVVLLAVNGGTDGEAAEALPRALERADEQLIVCGDPERLSALL
ncbi:hypothetical protein LHJ74_11930 [Streptomyces sp. N2-109]|uniref:Uncharacterized protein n=1 Tax=Streptomyces gossypii TaxID=2883101 RepID=A0ABT2JRU2_9ACTN|nr:hypothetical protein [Streptomyces gossypii]MCT2590607.1 hypothetical protein [Streptomyces gossypii]